MAQTMVNFRMDADLKKRMEAVCNEMGMNMTTAFTVFAQKVTREHRIPFEVSADPFYSESIVEFILRAKEELDAGRGIKRDLIDLEKMEQE